MTLNQVVDLLKKYGSSHKQINHVGLGDLLDWAGSEDATYPVMWVELLPSPYRDKNMKYTFQVFFADQVFDDNRNELEVQSDMLQVGIDIVAHFRDHPDYDVTVDADVVFNFFSGRFRDLTAGVYFNLTFNDPQPLNRCVIPI
ncbi:hypothetical protein KTO58_01280 [Chitinophaga pendula]|uniref:hypothetical protein n=1 Tax=Chitinophaga TaxID=79328 RepID=UPI000BAF1851|nr:MULTISPECIES: hypothetical protein [Chitinophaga]ASZ14504.1 hypothetical protein CK934_27935 [Chitinophaga sp. MD30]UCJ07838.1 hypothetical protein KTO58_01280 [Chitinophaga pendula]